MDEGIKKEGWSNRITATTLDVLFFIEEPYYL